MSAIIKINYTFVKGPPVLYSVKALSILFNFLQWSITLPKKKKGSTKDEEGRFYGNFIKKFRENFKKWLKRRDEEDGPENANDKCSRIFSNYYNLQNFARENYKTNATKIGWKTPSNWQQNLADENLNLVECSQFCAVRASIMHCHCENCEKVLTKLLSQFWVNTEDTENFWKNSEKFHKIIRKICERCITRSDQ